jgi:cell division protein ZapA
VSVSSKNTYEVVIAGIPLKIRSGQDPELVKSLVSFVDKKVREALHATKSGSVQSAALLAALNVAEEYFELKATALSRLDKVQKKAQARLDELEATRGLRAGLNN